MEKAFYGDTRRGRGNSDDGRKKGKEAEEKEEEKEEESEITKEELIKQLKKIKTGKTPGEDGFKNEVEIYAEEYRRNSMEIDEEIMEKEEEYQKKKGVMCPIFKKDEKEDVRNYKGIILMDTAYKTYASFLNKRLMNEIDDKFEEGQFSFRREREVIDAVYVLNHVVER